MKELDILLKDHVTPLLRAEGFRKSSHTYRLTLSGGDWIVVGFNEYPLGRWGSFYVTVAYVPQPALEMHNWSFGDRLDKPPTARWAEWAISLNDPDDVGGRWEYDSVDERARCVQALTDALPRALTVLRLLADRDVLLDLVEAPLRPESDDLPTIWSLQGGWSGLRMALLAERAASVELQPYIDFFAEGPSAHDEWAAARVAAGAPLVEDLGTAQQPRSDNSYGPLRDALNAALDRWVTPALAASGFQRTATGYERTTDVGDRAAVDIRLCWTSSEKALIFQVVNGLDPAPSREFLGFSRGEEPGSSSYGMSQPAVSVSWLLSVLRPTADFTSPIASHGELGLHPWAVPADRIDEGFRLLALVLAEASAPFLTSMLDRRTLLGFLEDPAHEGYREPWSEDMRAVLLLVDDETATGELAHRLDRIRRDVYGDPNHASFLAWIEDRASR